MPLLRKATRRQSDRKAEGFIEEALHEVKAAEETIWHALGAMGDLLTPGSHRSRGRPRRTVRN
ncbi:MAG TPA: hypothetical protein VFA11_02110 [Acidimicrobiales bacterium]|nr:hypothetical protein [Acidimicrobiales bacterium]